jgi:hypothetical protein
MRVFRRVVDGQESKKYYFKARIAGKQVFRATPYANFQQAEAWAKNQAAEILRSRSVVQLEETVRQIITDATPIPLDDVWDRFVKLPRRRAAGERQIAQKQAAWDDFRTFCADQGAKHVAEITVPQCAEYIAHLQQHGRYFKAATYKRSGNVSGNLKLP